MDLELARGKQVQQREAGLAAQLKALEDGAGDLQRRGSYLV